MIARGAKFIGTTMGGVEIILRDVSTGSVLASGITSGSTGDTERIMRTPLTRTEPRSLPKSAQQANTLPAAHFLATLDIDAPMKVLVEARGPLGQLQSANRVTSERWVFPGNHLTEGDGWLLEMPGLVVNIIAPIVQSSTTGGMKIEADVMLMCGCPITDGGLWDAAGYEVVATISRDGETIDTVPLAFAGTKNRFAVTYSPTEKGPLTITVTAWNARDGNSGLDRTAVFSN
ncbi:MAG: hypothetical protein AAGF15_07180 [Pseudomonadota bacterium]